MIAGESIRTLIVDDEPAARRGIAGLLADDPAFEIVGECANGAEMVDAVERLSPHLVFLDVQMPEVDGFAALSRLAPEALPLVIFVTAYDKYAVDAFEAHAFDFLLKPYSRERFDEARARARRHLLERRLSADESYRARLLSLLSDLAVGLAETSPPRGGAPQRAEGFLVRKSQGRILIVPAGDVLWIEAARDYVRLHTSEGAHLIRETMASVERRLGDRDFVRIHRSAIVRIDFVAELRYEGDGRARVQLRDGRTLPVSRTGRRRLQASLGLG